MMHSHSNEKRCAFTLIELLIASTIFIGLMGLLSVAFSRLSSGGQKAMAVMEMHAKADALMRFMEKELRTMPHIAAVHLKQESAAEPGTLTFMKQASNTHPYQSHEGRTIDTKNPYRSGSQPYRFVDIVWTRWEWGQGKFKAGDSRLNRYEHSVSLNYTSNKIIRRFNTALTDVLYQVNLDEAYGMQDNDVEPMVQRHYDFFEGRGNGRAPVDVASGISTATAGEKIQVYKTVGGSFFNSNGWKSDLFSRDDSPYRTLTQEFQGGDLSHHYTTLSVGSKDPLSDLNAYAVRNEDGQSLNKDRLNLVGAADTDAYDRALYPSQIKEIFAGVEFFRADFAGRDGSVIGNADESDRLSDGADSIDISGIEPESGVGMNKRPTHVRLTFLLHAIPLEEVDELDFDADNDVEEPLAKAIRDFVNSDTTLVNHAEKLRAFKDHAQKLGFVAIEFNQRVQLGY